jgi:hypothetical protein
MGATKGR